MMILGGCVPLAYENLQGNNFLRFFPTDAGDFTCLAGFISQIRDILLAWREKVSSRETPSQCGRVRSPEVTRGKRTENPQNISFERWKKSIFQALSCAVSKTDTVRPTDKRTSHGLVDHFVLFVGFWVEVVVLFNHDEKRQQCRLFTCMSGILGSI